MLTVLLVFVASGFWFTADATPDFVIWLFTVLNTLFLMYHSVVHTNSTAWLDEDARPLLAAKIIMDSINSTVIISALFVIFYITMTR